MGISTVASYTGAQIFEAVGPRAGRSSTSYFTGTTCKLGGVGLDVVAEEVARRHRRAYPRRRHRAGAPRAARSAASTSGAARASRTCSTPRRCSGCSTPPATGRYDVFKQYTAARRRAVRSG